MTAIQIQDATLKAELSILKTLAYFDIFSYPLSEQDIKGFLDCHVPEEEFRSALKELILRKLIFRFKEFYTLWDNPGIVERRVQGNLRADKLLPRAVSIGAFLYKFPFVKAVAISGSLSKNYADVKADIDFFIITTESRLWIARTFLHLFKKLTFLVGRQHFYCMNYFIDEKALLIGEQNIYSATEIVTLAPVAGINAMNNFFKLNRWVEEWLPAHDWRHELNATGKNFVMKNILELIFNKGLGDKLDDFLYEWTTRRWKKKEQRRLRNVKGRIMNLITGKHFSKSDPGAFQEKIVKMYDDKVSQLTNRLCNSPE